MTDTADSTSRDVAALPDASQDMFSVLLDMKAPQERYRAAIETGGMLEPMEGFALSFDRATTEHVLRHSRVPLIATGRVALEALLAETRS